MKNSSVEDFISKLYDDYYLFIYKFCLVKLKNPENAADCCQDVFTTAMTKLAKEPQEILKPKSWITTIAGFTVMSYQKKQAISQRRNIPIDDLEISDNNAAVIETIENLALGDIKLENILHRIKEAVSEKEHDIYNKYFREGHTIKSIADDNNISYDAAKSRIKRIKYKIKTIVFDVLS